MRKRKIQWASQRAVSRSSCQLLFVVGIFCTTVAPGLFIVFCFYTASEAAGEAMVDVTVAAKTISSCMYKFLGRTWEEGTHDGIAVGRDSRGSLWCKLPSTCVRWY